MWMWLWCAWALASGGWVDLAAWGLPVVVEVDAVQAVYGSGVVVERGGGAVRVDCAARDFQAVGVPGDATLLEEYLWPDGWGVLVALDGAYGAAAFREDLGLRCAPARGLVESVDEARQAVAVCASARAARWRAPCPP